MSGRTKTEIGRLLMRVLLVFGAGLAPVLAQEAAAPADAAVPQDYGLIDAAGDVEWQLAGLFAGVTVLGVESWNWGSSDFRFNSERWFGMDTGSAGADKLGHAFAGYAMTDFLTAQLGDRAGGTARAARHAALLTAGVMLYVEVFDGFSEDHGFAYEDLVMNSLGGAFSYLRSTTPWLSEKLDLRLQYWPSKRAEGYRPLSDYSGQKYVAALKLSGFDALRRTPLRFLELHAGYYSRGFLKPERLAGDERRASLYAGFSVNFAELLLRPFGQRHPRSVRYATTALEYVQLPFTSIEIERWDRRLAGTPPP